MLITVAHPDEAPTVHPSTLVVRRTLGGVQFRDLGDDELLPLEQVGRNEGAHRRFHLLRTQRGEIGADPCWFVDPGRLEPTLLVQAQDEYPTMGVLEGRHRLPNALRQCGARSLRLDVGGVVSDSTKSRDDVLELIVRHDTDPT
nr:hypothetical protein [Isoptericola croceus]